MSKRNYSSFSLINRILSGALVVLGFGCTSEWGESGGEECMYGTPTGKFQIKGKVTDNNGKEVAGAVVRITTPNRNSSPYPDAECKTDENGEYKSEGYSFPQKEMKVVCIPENTSLEPDSVMVPMDYRKDKHDKDVWYEGTAEATADFKLKEKKIEK